MVARCPRPGRSGDQTADEPAGCVPRALRIWQARQYECRPVRLDAVPSHPALLHGNPAGASASDPFNALSTPEIVAGPNNARACGVSCNPAARRATLTRSGTAGAAPGLPGNLSILQPSIRARVSVRDCALVSGHEPGHGKGATEWHPPVALEARHSVTPQSLRSLETTFWLAVELRRPQVNFSLVSGLRIPPRRVPPPRSGAPGRSCSRSRRASHWAP
jgi:hypothetical protein